MEYLNCVVPSGWHKGSGVGETDKGSSQEPTERGGRVSVGRGDAKTQAGFELCIALEVRRSFSLDKREGATERLRPLASPFEAKGLDSQLV